MLLPCLIAFAANAFLAYGLHLILVLMLVILTYFYKLMILDRWSLLFPVLILFGCLLFVKILRILSILLIVDRLGMPG